MKNLILVNGPMGAGKTATCRELQKLLPDNVLLDGDWCWDMRPFVVNEETKAMVLKNIAFLLNGFLRYAAYQNVIFCWVMHEQAILDAVLNSLEPGGYRVRAFSLVCGEAALEARLRNDVDLGLREQGVIARSLERLPLYAALDTVKIDVSTISAAQAAREIAGRIA